MATIILETISIALIVLSFVMLVIVLVKHFKGMEYPPYWIYFIGGFILLSLNSVFSNIAPRTELASNINMMFKLLASLSMFLGSFEVYRRYQSNISVKIGTATKPNKAAKSGKTFGMQRMPRSRRSSASPKRKAKK